MYETKTQVAIEGRGQTDVFGQRDRLVQLPAAAKKGWNLVSRFSSHGSKDRQRHVPHGSSPALRDSRTMPLSVTEYMHEKTSLVYLPTFLNHSLRALAIVILAIKSRTSRRGAGSNGWKAILYLLVHTSVVLLGLFQSFSDLALPVLAHLVEHLPRAATAQLVGEFGE